MTTPERQKLYEAQHLVDIEDRKLVVYNPIGCSLYELPRIYVFSAGGSLGWQECYAISEDGVILGSHICSSFAYAPHDLGALEGTREDRHENYYQKHYPGGYKMEVIPPFEVHEGLKKALELNGKLGEEDKLFRKIAQRVIELDIIDEEYREDFIKAFKEYHKSTPLNLEKWLNFDETSFRHDYYGIYRDVCDGTRCFLPRCHASEHQED